MKTKTDLSRITIDLPTEDHKKLKAMAAMLGKSMRELVIKSIENQLKNTALPPQTKSKTINKAEKGLDLFKELNI